ncbi:MAG TPA: phosphoribosylanthranilate isomerase [Rickettsiales bacterium]|nr:phosphoribosylanthranilate isomerase [Rickettsiales bacterium]
MQPVIKICGLKTREAIEAANAGDYLGFIFYPPSPRYIAPEDAGKLKQYAQRKTVAVTVNPNDNLLDAICSQFAPDYIQLHGSESPQRVAEIKAHFGLPVIKAFNIQTPEDFSSVAAYEQTADMLLFDAKSPKGLHGGTGTAFDWKMLAGRVFTKPYFLSGGIHAGNAEEALRISGARILDISSGVETAPGVKSPEKIAEFIRKVKAITL